MQSSHTPASTLAAFDEPHLLAHAGLAPALRLAERCGLPETVRDRVHLDRAANGAGTNADAKVMSLLAGMLTGADSIDDMDVLRHGATDIAFTGIRAPSTLGTFLRAFTWGHVRQLQAATRDFTCALARHCPLLPGADQVVHLDVDSKVKQVYGPTKQGASFGYTHVLGLHFQVVTASTPLAAPVIVATRLRSGSAGSSKGAAPLVAEAVNAVRAMGAGGRIVVRGDSAFFSHTVVDACRRAGVRFSVAVPQHAGVREAIAAIGEDAWTPIRYPKAVWDADEGVWISQAEVAEVEYTAFTSKPKKYHTTARLLVRRVERLGDAPAGAVEPFATWRFHAVFTDSRLDLVEAEKEYRRHAVVEQVLADLEDSALAHLPSGRFAANAAWLALAACAYNLTRALGVLASAFHARARTGTIRRQLVAVPARLAARARALVWHLPAGWPWAEQMGRLWRATGHRLAPV
jgi:hypothetical protein